MRKIYIVGSIDEDAFTRFCEELDECESEPVNTVEVILNSSGGSALDALAFYSRIRRSPWTIVVTIYGCCYSAAVLVLAAGDIRKMTRESWAMVHEDSDSLKNKTTSDIEEEVRQMRRLEVQWNNLLGSVTKLPADGWAKLHKSETYLTPEMCLEYGLIEEII